MIAWSRCIWDDDERHSGARAAAASPESIFADLWLWIPDLALVAPIGNDGVRITMLEVNAIDLHYGAAQALRAVSLKAEPGKVTCVLGRNGVGKTSLLDALAGEENLRTGFAPLKRDERNIPDDVFTLFPVLNDMLRRRGGDLSGGQQQQLAIGRALVMRPRLLLLDEPTEGIQPSIIKDIG